MGCPRGCRRRLLPLAPLLGPQHQRADEHLEEVWNVRARLRPGLHHDLPQGLPFGLLTVFAARTTGAFCSRLPSYHLGIAAMVAMGASTVLSHYWDDILDLPEMKSLTWKWIGFVWAYCLVWFLLQDVIKVCTYWMLYKMNIGSEAHHQGLMERKEKMVRKRDNRRALTHESVMRGESLMKASVRMTGKSTALQLEQDAAKKYKSMSSNEILAELSKLESKVRALKDALK